jgi:hypothetical protein
MDNFVEVDTPEKASHVLILKNLCPVPNISEGKVYELHYGFIGLKIGNEFWGMHPEDLEEFYIIEDNGIRSVSFMLATKKKWLLKVA